MRCTGLALVAAIGLAASPARAVTIEAVKSPGGITAWLVEDHSIPVVSMHAAFRGGAALDTGDKAGLANFVASLLDEGAGDLDSTSFQSKLEDLAGSLGFDVSRDNFMLRLRSPAGNVGPVFDLLRLALTSPRFDDGPVARIRAEIIDALARDQRLPVGIASRIWWQTEFPNHAYGRSILGTRASVAGITAEDMRGWLHTRLAKDTLVVAVVGDIAPANLRLLLDKTFGDLPDHAAPAALAEAVPRRLSEVLVDELAIPQSVVVFGQNGIRRDDPDWYAALLDLDILGAGGLTSRVALDVREDRGLAYSVSAALEPLRAAGLILGEVGSQNAKVAEALDLIRGEWRRMHDSGPTAKELADAKTYLTRSFWLNLDSTGTIAATLVSIQLDQLGLGYLGRRGALIDKVSLADARRVAKRVLDPEFAVLRRGRLAVESCRGPAHRPRRLSPLGEIGQAKAQ